MIACQKLPVILGQSLDQIKCERGFNQKLVNFMVSVSFFFLHFALFCVMFHLSFFKQY